MNENGKNEQELGESHPVLSMNSFLESLVNQDSNSYLKELNSKYRSNFKLVTWLPKIDI